MPACHVASRHRTFTADTPCWRRCPGCLRECPRVLLNRPLRMAMRRAEELRDEAVRAGDQPFGAVVLCGETIVGTARSRVITGMDPTGHAELEAIRDAARRLRTRDLSACVLVSTSRPCRMCEAAAGWAGISRMVYGEALTDAGPPR